MSPPFFLTCAIMQPPAPAAPSVIDKPEPLDTDTDQDGDKPEPGDADSGRILGSIYPISPVFPAFADCTLDTSISSLSLSLTSTPIPLHPLVVRFFFYFFFFLKPDRFQEGMDV